MLKMVIQKNLLMGNKINLYGASGHCKVIIEILLLNSKKIGDIFDDDVNKKEILEFLIKNSSQFDLTSNENLILSIGNNYIRKQLSFKLNANFVTAIHPKAIVSSFAKIDVGTVIMAGSVVNPDVRIGKHCIVNSGAIIEHDCVIDDFVHVSPNSSLAGGVNVNEGAQIGIGAKVIQGVKIGKWAIVGAGAVVIGDVPDFAVVVGNPARIIKHITIQNE